MLHLEVGQKEKIQRSFNSQGRLFSKISSEGLSGFPSIQQQGPFMRLDMPKLIEELSLFESPNVGKNHVLYTDTDVIFPTQ